MTEMKTLRKEDLSIYYYIRDDVLSEYIETEQNVLLEYIPAISDPPDSYVYEALSTMIPSPVDKGRGWVYFDAVSGTSNYCGTGYPTIEQSNRVLVYDSSDNLIAENEYMLDYIDGRVVTSGTVSPSYVTYDWYYVSVVDEWDGLYSASPPVVVIDIHGTDKTGFQLGGGRKNIRKAVIHIFASSASERKDLIETIYDGLYLKSCPLYSFPNGTVLDYDGTFYGRKDNMNKNETLFDRTTVSGIQSLRFDNVSARNVNPPSMLMIGDANETQLSDLNKYRAKITFDVVSYSNS